MDNSTSPLWENIISNRWIYKIKRHANGSIEWFNVRLIARGYTQEYGLDYRETFSPIIKHMIIRTMLFVTVSKGWQIRQLDVRNAFLNRDLEDHVYIVQP